jgi:hypothetical protein
MFVIIRFNRMIQDQKSISSFLCGIPSMPKLAEGKKGRKYLKLANWNKNQTGSGRRE